MRKDNEKKIKYLESLFPQNDILDKIKEKALEEQVLGMQMQAHEAQILEFLLKLIQATKVVEIGTLYGFSSFHMARALPPKGRLFTLDLNKKRQKISKEILKDTEEGEKITFISGEARKSLKQLEKEAPFDAVFIDADKSSYKEYLNWSEKNLRRGGLVMLDNSFLFGAVYGEGERNQNKETVKKIKELNESLCKKRSSFEGILIPTFEGLSVAVKK